MTAPTTERIDLDIEGMTCASCANRIERKLNKLDGVHATVNFATERAQIDHPSEVDTAALIEAIRSAGYDAAPVDDRPSGADDADPDADPDLDALRTRVLISAAMTIPVPKRIVFVCPATKARTVSGSSQLASGSVGNADHVYAELSEPITT